MRERRRSRPVLMVAAMAASLMTSGLASAQAPRRWPRQGEASLPPPVGTGRLRNAVQGKCLDVAGWAAQGNSNVLLWDCNNDPDQVWSFASGELHNGLTGSCLDVAGYDGAQGANVDVFRCEGLDDQRWTLVPRGQGTFELHSLKRGLCLDVVGKAGARGDNVLLWACDGGADQTCRWEPYAAPPPRYAPERRPGPPPRGPSMPPELEVPQQPPPPTPTPPGQRPRDWRREARPMGDETFRALLGAVNSESLSEGKLNVVEQAATRNVFRTGQVKALIDQMGFSATKQRTLELCAPRIVDPENAFTLYEAFTFSGDKEQAKQILKRNGY